MVSCRRIIEASLERFGARSELLSELRKSDVHVPTPVDTRVVKPMNVLGVLRRIWMRRCSVLLAASMLAVSAGAAAQTPADSHPVVDDAADTEAITSADAQGQRDHDAPLRD